MKRISLIAILALATSFGLNAQTSTYKPARAPLAYASGNDSYIFHSDSYDPAKKYVVLKVWNDKDEPGEAEAKEFEQLKKLLAKKNIEVASYKWTDQKDLVAFLSKYGLNASVKENSCVTIKAENSSLNTTASKTIFILEDGKARSLCSGTKCETNVKQFFGLASFD